MPPSTPQMPAQVALKGKKLSENSPAENVPEENVPEEDTDTLHPVLFLDDEDYPMDFRPINREPSPVPKDSSAPGPASTAATSTPSSEIEAKSVSADEETQSDLPFGNSSQRSSSKTSPGKSKQPAGE